MLRLFTRIRAARFRIGQIHHTFRLYELGALIALELLLEELLALLAELLAPVAEAHV